MRKLISILLVAMLVIGMFPATVFAEETSETLSIFATTGALGTDTISWTQNGVTFTNNKGSSSTAIRTSDSDHYRIYANSNVVITAPGNITKIVITATTSSYATAMYNSVGDEATASGSTVTIVPTASATTYTIAKMTAQSRINKVAVTYAASVSECEHTNTEPIGEAKDPTCTETGITAGEKCADCGETITAQETIPATGHSYAEGVCSVCGAEEPDGFVLTDIANIQSTDKVVITMTTANGTVYALTNGNGTSSAPAATTVTVTDNTIAEVNNNNLIWNVVYDNGNIEIYPNGTTDTWLYCTSANNGVRVGTNTNKVFTIDASSGYLKNTSTSRYLGVYTTTPDWRCYTSSTTTNIANQTLAFYVQSAGGSDCEHDEGTTVKENETAATCTQEGSYENVTRCTLCDSVISRETVSIPVSDHVYENGACTSCGKVDPDLDTKAELMTALPSNGDKIIIYNPSSETAMGCNDTDVDSKLDAVSTAPVDALLPYNDSVAVLTVEFDGEYYALKLSNGTYLATDTDGGQLTFEATASDLTLWSIAAVDSLWTITSKSATNTYGAQVIEYYWGEYTTYAGSGNAFNMALYLVEPGEDACTHGNTIEQEDGYDATCISTGKTNSLTCDECGVTVTAQQEIPALGHEYEDGACIRCGAAAPARYYIAAYRDSEGQYYYMTSDLGEASTKRYQAVDTNVLPSNIDPDETLSNHVFILTDNGDGTYYLQAEGVTGDNYLGWTSGNSGILVAKDSAHVLTVDVTEEGYYNFSFQPEGAEKARYLSLNGTTGNNYFAWYEGTQKQDLVLIPVEEIEEGETITMTLYGAVDGITVSDNQILDLNGKAATNVTGTDIRVYDSTATVTTAGTGTLTVTEGSTVVIDNTVDGTRYIALKDNEGTYTFHVLELQLSAISLRASQAGIYYKAIMNCDDTLKGATKYHGMVVSVNNMPGADFDALTEEADNNAWTKIDGAPSEGNMTSVAVFGIFKAGKDNATRGAMKIYANAYLQLTTGEVIMADTTTGDKAKGEEGGNENFDGIAWSLKDVMQALNTSFSTQEADDQTSIVNFYKAWSSVMSTWELGNIAAAAATPAE